MKMKKFLPVILLLVFGAIVLAACSGELRDRPQDVEADNPLIGSWSFEGMLWYTFNADGTGTRPTHLGVPGTDTFTWWTLGDDHLRMNMTAGPLYNSNEYLSNESWTFSISGSTLTLDSRLVDDTHRYTRVE